MDHISCTSTTGSTSHQDTHNCRHDLFTSIMNIVTPSHSNDDHSHPYSDCVSLPEQATAAVTMTTTTTTKNHYFDAIWIHGRTLTDTEWNELSILKVRGIAHTAFTLFPVLHLQYLKRNLIS